MSEAYELIEAIYGPEGWEENKIENPERYNSLLRETTGKHAIYGKGFILGIVREILGRPIVCEVVAGSEWGLRYFYNLQTENKNLSMIIKAIEEGAIVDFNNDLLAFIKESKKMSADEIEQALQGKKRD
jgi:hypothetical protein